MVHRNQVLELEIEDLAFGGQAIARLRSEEGEFVLFVENAFPGQKVLVRVDKKRNHSFVIEFFNSIRTCNNMK
ncbi:MAG: TRAM domain-containing protein [Fluviicola sp.]